MVGTNRRSLDRVASHGSSGGTGGSGSADGNTAVPNRLGSSAGVTGIASRNVSGELCGSDHSSSGDNNRASPNIQTGSSLVMHVQKQLQRSSMPRKSVGRVSSVVQMLLANSASPGAGIPTQPAPSSEQLVGVDGYDEDGPLRLSPGSAQALLARRSLASPSVSSRLVPPHAVGPSSSGSASNGPGSRDTMLMVRHPLSGSSTR